MAKTKVSRNDPCPCLSGIKYKKCCEGKVPWSDILKGNWKDSFPYLSARGKNIYFLHAISATLQLDKIDSKTTWADIKRAVTPNAVRFLHEAVVDLWPSQMDLERVLLQEKESMNGLYVGGYEPEFVLRGVTRHCLYSDAILLIDPFLYPTSVREEYSPILKPEEHITSTIMCVSLWFSLAPWIEAGVVKFVRTPGDFDHKVMWECLKLSRDKLDRYPELKSILEKDAEKKVKEENNMKEYYFYSHPDDYIIDVLRKGDPEISEDQIKAFLTIQREEHPYLPLYPEGEKPKSEIIHWTTGTNYEMAKIIAQVSGSHLITDIPSRWKEIELDRAEANIDHGNWSPFAKAFQETKWKHLENVNLQAAFKLRKQNRLEDMRHFLRKVWKESNTGEPFDRGNAENLAAELNERVREADSEWSKIDQELLKYFGGTTAAGIIAAGPAIATGKGLFVATAYAVAGVTEIAVSQYKRSKFPKKYPAGFFLGH